VGGTISPVPEVPLGGDERVAVVFRVEMDKALAFAKASHAQTTYRLSAVY
jgi:hypothetical protein